MEIFNPSNVPLSLADYMLCYSRPNKGHGPNSLEEAISETDYGQRAFYLKFGYYLDTARTGEGVYFKETTSYEIDVEPFQTFFIKTDTLTTWAGEVDFYALKKYYMDVYGWIDGSQVSLMQDGTSMWLLKCTNDSVVEGSKSADDINDWEFVDIYGTVG